MPRGSEWGGCLLAYGDFDAWTVADNRYFSSDGTPKSPEHFLIYTTLVTPLHTPIFSLCVSRIYDAPFLWASRRRSRCPCRP